MRSFHLCVLMHMIFHQCGWIQAMDCIGLSSGCGCELEDHSARIDLTPMTKLAQAPMFSNIPDKYTDKYFVDMCRDFTCGTATGKTCMALEGAEKMVIGKDLTYEYDGSIVTFVYQYTGTEYSFNTRIILHCSDKDGIGTITDIEPNEDLTTFRGTLTSKYACFQRGNNSDQGGGSKALSNGSILCIVLLVVVVVYIVGGILINKYVRKVENDQLFPNKEFWKKLPGLIKDGCKFTVNKIRKKDEYEKI